MKVDAIKPPNVRTIDFLQTRPAEFFMKLKTPPKRDNEEKNSSGINSPGERVILVSDLKGNPINGPPKQKKDMHEAEVQTAFDLPYSMLKTPEQRGVILQTCVSSRNLNSAFKREEQKKRGERPPIQSEENKHGSLNYPNVAFFEQMVNVPGFEGVFPPTKETGIQTKLTFAAKVTTEVQTDFHLQVSLASSVITQQLRKMCDAMDQLKSSYSNDLCIEPEKLSKEEFLLKSADRLRTIIVEAIMAQQQSISEIGLLKP